MSHAYMDISLGDARARLGQLYYDVARLVKGGFPRVLAVALNDAGKAARTEGTRLVRARYALKAGTVNKNFVLNNASASNLRVRFRSRYARTGLHLTDYSIKKTTRKGRVRAVSAQVLQGGGFKEVKGGFIIRGRNSGKPILVKRVGKERFPLKTLYGPNISAFLNDEANLAKLRTVAQAQFEARFVGVAERMIAQALNKPARARR